MRIVNCCYLLLGILITLSFHDSNAQSQWYWVEPMPSGNMLYSVYFSSVNTGYAAGSFGTVMKSTDAGVTWEKLNTGITADLYSIYFIDDENGFCAGRNGSLISTTNGGNDWKQINSDVNENLHDICFAGNSTGYAVGLLSTILKTTNAGVDWKKLKTNLDPMPLFCADFINSNTGMIGGYNALIRTTDGGFTFTAVDGVVVPSTAITGISFGGKNHVFAAGNSVHGSFYRSTNGGLNWTSASLDLPYLWEGTVDLVRSMNFINNNTGYIVTDFGTILRTTDSGIEWKKDSTNRPAYEKLSVLHDVNAFAHDKIYACGNGGTVIGSFNSGIKWNTLTGNKRSLYASTIISGEAGYCVGECGHIMKSVDNGSSWTRLTGFTNKFLKTVCFTDNKVGYVAGDRGVIFKTEDEGSGWKEQTHYTNLDYKSIAFINELTGIVAGGNPENERAFIYKTINGGTNWYEVYDSITLGIIRSAEFNSEYSLIACGDNGNVLYSFDQGENWFTENISNENLNTSCFKDAYHGIIGGSNGMTFRTSNAGMNWTMKHTGFFNTITCIKHTGSEYYMTGNNGFIATSKDDGDSWQRHGSITGNRLNSISIAGNSVLAFGEYGTILRSDPGMNVVIGANSNSESPGSFILSQNYPNPFNPETKITVNISDGTGLSHMRLAVYDVTGREVSVLYDDHVKIGVSEFEFNADGLPGGVYFCSLYLDERIRSVKRMVCLK